MIPRIPSGLFFLFLLFAASVTSAQLNIGRGKVDQLYQEHCAICHGKNYQGGLGGNLFDGEFKHGSTDAEIANVIRNGLPSLGMTPYNSIFSEEEIRSLVIFIREKTAEQEIDRINARTAPRGGVINTEKARFRLARVAEHPDIFWSLDFLPDGRILAAQFNGNLRLINNGLVSEPVKGTPEVLRRGQAGLMEVQLHPDYKENGWIYLGYVESFDQNSPGRPTGLTAIVRGRIRDGQWVDQESIIHFPRDFHTGGGVHFGTRFVFDKGYLYFAIGDRGRQNQAQDLSTPYGKIFRIHDDGRIPRDNPFANSPDALPAIWSYGHRNPQGLDQHPVTGQIWSTEHGPRGGDELNLIKPSLNYGWPRVTFGMNYNGTPITDQTSAPGLEAPAHHWTPSIAVCGIDFYTGDKIPAWKNDLFIGGLASEELHRFRIEGERIVEKEIVLTEHGRVRDVHNGPDGYLYVILNKDRESGPGVIYRLEPAD